MTPYVELQEVIISRLFRLLESGNTDLLREIVACARDNNKRVLNKYMGLFESQGTVFPTEPWVFEAFVEILQEQIDDNGNEISIKNLLGKPLYNYGHHFGTLAWRKKVGSGECRLRTRKFSQPGALKVGDVLATDCVILSPPREGGNGAVLIHLTGGHHGHWISVPARIPIALRKAVP